MFFKQLFTITKRNCHQLKKTPFYDFHVKSDAKMIPFAGWEMPGSYNKSSMETAQFIRSKCGIFDVSHMFQFLIHGNSAEEFLEKLVPADLKSLAFNKGVYTVLLNSNGGIEDDLIINKIRNDEFYVVSNASRASVVFPIINGALINYDSSQIKFEPILNRALIAIQGPNTEKILNSAIDMDLSGLKFMNSSNAKLFGVHARITRCGYTGEDGFEISFPSKGADKILESIMRIGGDEICMAGLITRDILRTEAGLCLYGHDINSTTTPIEAGIGFTVAKRRRELKNFPGAEKIMHQIKNGVADKRVGFISESRIPRIDNLIFDENGTNIGHVTSGVRSPTLDKNIGIGYVHSKFSKVGTSLNIGQDLKNSYRATVTGLPFVPTNYKN